MSFILASGSPRRRELLASLGINFNVIKSDIDETQHPGEAPLVYVRRLSVEKAGTVAARAESGSLILAADTVVIHEGDILGKPADPAEARAMLVRLRDQAHTVCTALTLLKKDANIGAQHAAPLQPLTELTQTEVIMRAYTNAEIEAYIATGDPFDKAGGYAIQHEGFHPVARIEGSYTNVVGLPLETLKAMLIRVGYDTR
jgi:septum formation protein